MAGDPGSRRTVLSVDESLLGHNEEYAVRNRSVFREHGLFVAIVLSSPGSGKTTLIRRPLTDLAPSRKGGVIVGDLATDNDARRLADSGAPVTQILTGTMCHLEASMVGDALGGIDLSALDYLIIENVGNLVCPASYDLGEDVRIGLLSVTEGEDKPLKYPVIFKTVQAVVITKIDMASAAGFDRSAALHNIAIAAPDAEVFEVSARTAVGLDTWYAWLESRMKQEKT